MDKRKFYKAVGPYVAALSVLVLAALLIVVIFFTEFNFLWIAFLTGILVAAILSMVSRSSKAEWIISRRDAKISSLQRKLSEEIRLRHELEQKLADRLILDTGDERQKDTVAITEGSPSSVTYISNAEQDLSVEALSEQAEENDATGRILSAIEHDEFRLYCQRIAPLPAPAPQYSHYEILIRLREEETGMMQPGAFFPLVEKYGLMTHLDQWVVKHVIEWIAAHPAPDPLLNQSVFFINLSTESLADGGFPQFVRDQLWQHRISPGVLCFEINENDLSWLRDGIVLFAKKIRDNGCRIAVCNFGRDRVSFQSLHEIHADFLKINGSIILNLLRDPAELARVTAIARSAKIIGVKTIAEMVENDGCMAKLRQIGIDYAQGFGVALPSPLDDCGGRGFRTVG